MRSHQNISASSFCGWRHPQRPETEVLWCDLPKTAKAIVGFNRLNWNLTLWLPINGALLLFVKVTQMYITLTLIMNAILVTKIFCYRYLTLVTSLGNNIFSTKFGDRFSNLLKTKCTNFYLDLLWFDISIVRVLGVTFFGHSVVTILLTHCSW